MFNTTIADGSTVESMFLIKYEFLNELGEWVLTDMVGGEDAEETFRLARELQVRDNIKNIRVVREDAVEEV